MNRWILVLIVLGLSPVPAALAADPPRRDDTRPAAWPNGLPATPDFFPIAVWLQTPATAAKYKELGINVYVGLWKGPTKEQLDALEAAGLYVICHQTEFGLTQKDRKVIAGWMHGDEPDNAQPLGEGKGYGPPIPPASVVADYRRMRAADPTRPVLLNLGQGVAWDKWHGRGVRTNHPEDYVEYVKGCDIASFDIYPVTHTHPDVAGNLWYVGRGVGRLVEWTGGAGAKPVWCCIETTHVDNERAMPTPRQVRAEVWIALVHGATGIIYFAHEFKPQFIEAGLLARPEMAAGVKAINQEIRRLAPVLNSPTAPDAARVTSDDAEAPVAVLCKQQGGATYLFAVATRDRASTATFTVAGAAAGESEVEVIGESRTLKATGGKFQDRFDGYGIHLYKLRP